MATRVTVLKRLFLVSICSNCIALTLSLLNLEELKSIKYGMEISGTPVLLRETPDLSNTLLLSSKHGQQYQCTLPVLKVEELDKDDRSNFTTEEITELLKSMENRCLYHNKGWWTYEFCFGKSVEQYHEEGNTVVGDKILLGVYSSQTDWAQEKIEIPYSKDNTKRYHSQYFKNGTKCDVSGEQRVTQVKFMCELGKSDYIFRVDEPSSCSYLVEVYTKKLCKHPLFRPAPSPKPKSITCSPAITQEQYDIYLATLEIKKEATEARRKAKEKRTREIRAERRRERDDFDSSDYFDSQKKRTRKPIRSQLWPWENPGVENDDELWINGHINDKEMEVNRMDIMKGRKKLHDKDNTDDHHSVIIMSRGLQRERRSPPKVKSLETEGTEEKKQDTEQAKESEQKRGPPLDKPRTDAIPETKDFMAEKATGEGVEIHTPEKQPIKPPQDNAEGEEATLGVGAGESKPDLSQKGSEVEHGDTEATKTDKEERGKQKHEEGKTNIKQGTESLEDTIIEKEEKGEGKDTAEDKTEKSLEDEWRDAFTKARMQLRSVVRKQLKGMGVNPDELERKLKVMMGKKVSEKKTVPKPESGKLAEETPNSQVKEDSAKTENTKPDSSAVGLRAAVDKKLDRLMHEVESMEKDGRLGKESKERRMLLNIKKLIKGMDHQNLLLMKKEETLQKALERHFDELRDRFSIEATLMKRFIEDIEGKGKDEGFEDDYLKSLVERLKTSVYRYAKATRDLADDMAAVKELNNELHNKLDNIVSKKDTREKGSDFFRLAAKANLLLRRLLHRSAQLDKEMRAIREISREALARREEYLDEEDEEFESGVKAKTKLKGEAKARMDSIIERLKTMIKDVDSGKASEKTLGDDGEKLGSNSQSMFSDDKIKVRVTKIKGENGNALWSEEDGKRDLQEMGIEGRLKRASRKMESMVKEQLKNAGIAPTGKVHVKIITSREALENFGSDKGMEILSEEETSQFKKMIMNLLGGSQEAGDERKRQLEMENNYNMVWNKDQFKTATSGNDDEPEAELIFDDTEY